MWQTKQLVLHGAIILLIGFACGAPMGRSIVRRKSEDTVRAWRVAHSSLVMGGILLLAIAGVVEHLRLGGWALSLLAVSFIGSSYAFAISLPLGAHYGFRGLTPAPPLLNRVVYAGNILGIAGFFVGALLLIWGACAGL
jgi:hypothetical protein